MIEKLKPEVKTLWLEALRSGRYEQGEKNLERDGKFCCLGVLCDLAVQAGVIEKKGTSLLSGDGLVAYGTDSDLYHTALPPAAVHRWAVDYVESEDVYDDYIPQIPIPEGKLKDWTSMLNEGDPLVRADQIGLTTLNDQIGLNFDQIADLIEEYL